MSYGGDRSLLGLHLCLDLQPCSFSPEPLLSVEELRAAYTVGGRRITVLDGVSFSIRAGEIVVILGESGCGKTTAALAILGLLPPGAMVQGSVRFRGKKLLEASEDSLQKIRGAQISFVPQEPALSLNPVIRVRDHVGAVARAHGQRSVTGWREQARAALDRVRLDTDRLQMSYPHQLSGGQRQRVLLAQAMVCGPSVLIADEPTSSLDAAAQAEILILLCDWVRQASCALLLITHDPRIARAIAHRVVILYAGRIVESGPAADVLDSPLHPYTRGLIACVRDPLGNRRMNQDRHLPAIPGSPPGFPDIGSGCAFEPRCADRKSACVEANPAMIRSGSHDVRCILYGRG
jgi:oligopeptide/dipeptide ABC transporter ATP-binding protein